MRIYIGVDNRQPVAFHVLCHSIWKRASKPVDIIPLNINSLPIKRKGLTEFTYTRYLPPYLMGYAGSSLFLDADMLVLDDIYNLEEECKDNWHCAVSVVKNEQRFEWPSMMYFNNYLCKKLTPELIENGKPQTFEWAKSVGNITKEWNHCVGYDKKNENAKLVHFTQGIPCFKQTKNCEYSEQWNDELKSMASTVTWEEIMGTSVHKKVMNV